VKISPANMKKLGFRKYGNTWQHNQLQSLRFTGCPSWESVVEKSVKYGVGLGKEVAQRDIKRVLGID
jgi:hypothetical protein